jgi:hypothetical protein
VRGEPRQLFQGGVSGTLITWGARMNVGLRLGNAWACQRFLGSVRDFALFGLVLMLHPLHLLGKY